MKMPVMSAFATLLFVAQPAAAQDALAAPSSALEPARLEAAQRTVLRLLPPGTYARMMEGSMEPMMDMVLDSVAKMSLRDIAAMGGIAEEELATVPDGPLKDMMMLLDPAYDERMRLTTRAMNGEMANLMTQFEPSIRDGLAQAYAKRFTTAQLDELTTFFSSGTGALYAADSLALFMDPAVMAKMQEFMPQMMQAMPAITSKVVEATKHLPPPRKVEDLSAEERAQLDAMLGKVRAEEEEDADTSE
ncbi:DUF2059 domain-containing protein [Novosphingobium aquimarinum]|uniref:DUF2059 domain-containing protein n=1 Tax=Novosphingobium aquimarinum TaxID=2682494 RepID=UPI0012EC5F16|nr:DUF2059 domain-containing protein [Novosphingobium aquimarinum]